MAKRKKDICFQKKFEIVKILQNVSNRSGGGDGWPNFAQI